MSKQAYFINVALALGAGAVSAAEEASPPPSLEEVVVTAERRSTNLQTTGISASVLTGADLTNKGIMSVDGLQAIAPSVVIDNFGQGNDFNIRGIGKGEHNSQTTIGVITYRDGVRHLPGLLPGRALLRHRQPGDSARSAGHVRRAERDRRRRLRHTNDPNIAAAIHGYRCRPSTATTTTPLLQGAVNLPISDTLAAASLQHGTARQLLHLTWAGYDGNHGELEKAASALELSMEAHRCPDGPVEDRLQLHRSGRLSGRPGHGHERPVQHHRQLPAAARDRPFRSAPS